MEYLLIDLGLSPAEVAEKVQVGDLVSYAQPPLNTSGETLVGHSLDNRISVAALTASLQQLATRQHAWDVWALASTQEEVTMAGAATSAFQINPTLAVTIDVTFAASPGSPAHRTFPMGKGPTLAWGPNVHPAVFKRLKEVAEKFEIPYALEVIPKHSGTDTFAMQIVAEGIPTAIIGIPLRYMHTPVEMISLKDLRRTAQLLTEFICSLDENFVNQMTWDE